MDNFVSEAESHSLTELHADLVTRARSLLADLIAFQLCLREQKKNQDREIRQFISNVQSEIKNLEKAEQNFQNINDSQGAMSSGVEREEEMKRLHLLRSSNLPFYEAVWDVATRCRGVVALSKRMQSSNASYTKASRERNGADDHCSKGKVDKTKPNSVYVDIVAEEGAEWIKVSTKTEKRLLFEMAKEGWEEYDEPDFSSGSDDTTPDRSSKGSAKNGGLELLKLAEDMKKAASIVRVRYRHPRARFILPKITEGRVREIDAVLGDLRATGVTVECCSKDYNETTSIQPSPSLSSILSTMLPSALPALTPTLNIDCTILLALISDISHFRPSDLLQEANTTLSGDPISNPFTSRPVSAIYHSAILQQIHSEESAPLLPAELYPILAGQKLVCTHEAAERMREIVDTMGTQPERVRAEIFLGEGAYAGTTADALCNELRKISAYSVPDVLNLPIERVSYDADAVLWDSTLPQKLPVEMARDVNKQMQLSEINKSVFFYGWDTGNVTVTSNRAVAAGIEKAACALLDRYESEDCAGENGERGRQHQIGPDMWICRTARSLIGKEKTRPGPGQPRGQKAA